MQLPITETGTKPRIIDAYCHFSPPDYMAYLDKASGGKNMWHVHYDKKTIMHDMQQRIRFMDESGVDISVLVPTPWLESVPDMAKDPAQDLEAARVCNDALAKEMQVAPGRVYGVGVVPTYAEPDVMVGELDRMVDELGFLGVELAVGPTAKRVDHPTMEPLFARAAERGIPVWFHPSRPKSYSDYADEDESKYFDWQTLGWLHDTASAMIRVVFSGMFAKYPTLKIITHHHGALIPLFANRMQLGWTGFEKDGAPVETSVQQPYIEHFRKFYCDTATFGYEPLLLQQAHSFFAPEHMVFGSDTPFDPEDGVFLANAVRSVESLPIPERDRLGIYAANFETLIGRELGG